MYAVARTVAVLAMWLASAAAGPACGGRVRGELGEVDELVRRDRLVEPTGARPLDRDVVESHRAHPPPHSGTVPAAGDHTASHGRHCATPETARCRDQIRSGPCRT